MSGHKVSPARDAALRVLLAVEKDGAYANLELRKLTRRSTLAPSDISLLTELVYGTLRRQGTLDYVIEQHSTVPLSQMNYIIRSIARLGVYQLLYLDRVPARAVCSESVELAKSRGIHGLAGFVNALLRSISRSKERISFPDPEKETALYLSIKHSHPQWLVERWLMRFGKEETAALCAVNNQPAPVVLRCNTLKNTPDQLMEKLRGEGLMVRSSALIPEGIIVEKRSFLPELKSFRDGLFAVQDESSMIASSVLNPLCGSFVVDACSGPGGKTTHLGQLMNNEGRILALDVHEHRLALVDSACRRLGVTIVETRHQDARELQDKLEDKADFILVDVPCSGLGVIRRRPELRWRVECADLSQHAAQQLEILGQVSKCLKTGGLLLYSTCSTEPEENTGVVNSFLMEYTGFKAEELAMPFHLVHSCDKLDAKKGFLQLLPHRHGTDGFFLACFRKTEESR